MSTMEPGTISSLNSLNEASLVDSLASLSHKAIKPFIGSEVGKVIQGHSRWSARLIVEMEWTTPAYVLGLRWASKFNICIYKHIYLNLYQYFPQFLSAYVYHPRPERWVWYWWWITWICYAELYLLAWRCMPTGDAPKDYEKSVVRGNAGIGLHADGLDRQQW